MLQIEPSLLCERRLESTGQGDSFMPQELLLSALAAPLISAIVAFFIARAQIRVKLREIENFYLELAARMESHRQEQLQDVLRARIIAYPKLWQQIVSHTINWPYQRRSRDVRWAIEFVESVDSWNAEHGVFLSEASYVKFHEFRRSLAGIARSLDEDERLSVEEYKVLFKVFTGDRSTGEPGLATQLKLDLGSYGEPMIRRPEFALPSQDRRE